MLCINWKVKNYGVKSKVNVASEWSFQTQLMANMKFNQLMSKKYPPPFVPNNETLNCDPTYELEEMIVEAKPLHKKKKRLMRQQSLLSNSPSSNNSIHGSDVSTCIILNLTNWG